MCRTNERTDDDGSRPTRKRGSGLAGPAARHRRGRRLRGLARRSRPQAPQSGQRGGLRRGRWRRPAAAVAALGPVPVVVSKVARSSIPVYLNGLGNVTAFYTVTVKSRVDGQIMKLDFNEGDLVTKARFSSKSIRGPIRCNWNWPKALWRAIRRCSITPSWICKRYQTLLAQDAIPKQQLDTQTALVAQYEGNIKQDTANIDSAKLNLTYAKVMAPITGVVGLRQVDPGNIVHASDANGMIVITQLQPISVLFTIPEDNLPQVIQKLRAGANLPVDAYNRDNSKKIASGMLVTRR